MRGTTLTALILLLQILLDIKRSQENNTLNPQMQKNTIPTNAGIVSSKI